MWRINGAVAHGADRRRPRPDTPLTAATANSVRRLAIAAVSGAVLSLTLPPFDVLPALFSYAPLLLVSTAVDRECRRPVERALLFAVFGATFHLCGLWWVGSAFLVDAETFGPFLPFAVIGTPLLLAPFYAVAGILVGLAPARIVPRYAAMVAALALVEFLRGVLFTGFPWNVPAVQIAASPILAQGASIVGVEGMALVAVALGALPAVLLARRSAARSVTVATVVACFVVLCGYGIGRLATVPPADGPMVRVVQPNVAQHHKWDPTHRERIWRTLRQLSAGSDAALVVWPETALPFLYRVPSMEQGELAAALGPAQLITGVAEIEPMGAGLRRTNSVYVIQPGGILTARYDKVRLVPFGEFLPFAGPLNRLGLSALADGVGRFEAGTEPAVLSTAIGPVQPLICYEVIFAGFRAPQPVRALVNVTNDAWFGATPGPAQHLRHASLRAIEQGRPVLRSANTGISAIIDGAGRLVEALPLNVQGQLEARLPAIHAPPHGGRPRLAAGIAFALVVAGAIVLGRRSDRVNGGR